MNECTVIVNPYRTDTLYRAQLVARRRQLPFLTTCCCSDDSKPYMILKALDEYVYESYKNHIRVAIIRASGEEQQPPTSNHEAMHCDAWPSCGLKPSRNAMISAPPFRQQFAPRGPRGSSVECWAFGGALRHAEWVEATGASP